MKKILALLLMVCLLCLWGCDAGITPPVDAGGSTTDHTASPSTVPGTTENTDPPTQPGQSVEIPEYVGPGYAVMLRVTINPAVTLYLDSDGMIIRVEAGNADGETLLSLVEVIGLSYDDGMTALLNTANDQGYLSDGSQIAVEFEEAEAGSFDRNPYDVITPPFAQFQFDMEISLELSVGLYAEEIPKNQDKVVVNGQTLYLLHLPHEDGIKTVYFTAENPQSLPEDQYYQAMVKSVDTYDDGSVEIQYYDRGKCTHSSFSYPDGEIGGNYYEDEVIVSAFVRDSYGNEFFTTFYCNGNQKTEDVKEPGGGYSHRDYDENGRVTSSIFQYDGEYREEYYTYYENGELATYILQVNEFYKEEHYHYNEDGSEDISVFVRNEDGTESTYTKHVEGNTETINWPNGDYQQTTYYDYPMPEIIISLKDGLYKEVYYSLIDGAFCVTRTYTVRPDGVIIDQRFEEIDGKPHSEAMVVYPDGKVEFYSN